MRATNGVVGIIVTAVTWMACSTSTGSGSQDGGAAQPTACTPGDQKGCACPGGGNGVQVCAPDGTAYGDCTGCGGTAGSAGTGGTGGTAGSAGTGGTAGTAGNAGAGGTAGTAGTGGSGGTGGTAGTGGTGGQCMPANPSQQACETCINTQGKCYSQYANCKSDPACAGLGDCIAKSSCKLEDKQCMDKCRAQFPTGQVKYENYVACVYSVCTSDCLPAGCPWSLLRSISAQCQDCLNAKCCSQCSTLWHDKDFMVWTVCLSICGSAQACASDCVTKYPNATANWNAFGNCTSQNCSPACD